MPKWIPRLEEPLFTNWPSWAVLLAFPLLVVLLAIELLLRVTTRSFRH
jgi:hypothetical protein